MSARDIDAVHPGQVLHLAFLHLFILVLHFSFPFFILHFWHLLGQTGAASVSNVGEDVGAICFFAAVVSSGGEDDGELCFFAAVVSNVGEDVGASCFFAAVVSNVGEGVVVVVVVGGRVGWGVGQGVG